MEKGNEALENLDKILEFQIKDLTNALYRGNANFLVAQGCMHVIEFLGGIRNGELRKRGKVESRFKEGIRLLGGEYVEFNEDTIRWTPSLGQNRGCIKSGSRYSQGT